ncbi:MAG: hypothetical protein LBU60_03340 [Clostridiales bacterium]|nr:hypothetical protein [Clostridiales bacterium]
MTKIMVFSFVIFLSLVIFFTFYLSNIGLIGYWLNGSTEFFGNDNWKVTNIGFDNREIDIEVENDYLQTVMQYEYYDISIGMTVVDDFHVGDSVYKGFYVVEVFLKSKAFTFFGGVVATSGNIFETTENRMYVEYTDSDGSVLLRSWYSSTDKNMNRSGFYLPKDRAGSAFTLRITGIVLTHFSRK